MWILTTFGFYSVIRKPGDKESAMLKVRGRARADLESLKDDDLPEAKLISENDRANYTYRLRVNAADFGAAITRMVADIDYSNFKDAIARRQGSVRHEV